MPSLPIAQLQAQALLPQVDPSTSAFSPRGDVTAVARGAASIATGIAQQIEQDRHAEDNLAVTNAMSQLRAGMPDDLADDGSPDGMADRIAGRFQKRLQDQYKQMSPRAGSRFAEVAAPEITAQLKMRANEAERQARQAGIRAGYAEGVQADGQAVFADPFQAVDILARRQASTDLLPLPESERSVLKQRASQSIAEAAVKTMIDRDPANVAKQLNEATPETIKDNPILSSMSAESLEALKHHANTEVSRIAAEGRVGIAGKTQDVQAMVLNGTAVPQNYAPTVEEYTAAYGANGPALWQEKVGNYLAISAPIRQMLNASPAEREAMVQAQEPGPGAGFAAGLQRREFVLRAKQLVERQIVADPAAYALQNSPRVKDAYAAMQHVLGDSRQSLEDRQAVVDFYLRASEAEQERLGVSVIRDDTAGNKPRGAKPLTNAEANAYADRFKDRVAGGAPADAAMLIQGLEQQYGKNWTKVYSQLASENKLPAAALVIPNMPNDASRAQMAAVSALKPEELDKLVSPSDRNDIRDKVLAQFDQAQRTFVSQGGGGYRTLAITMGEAEKLAISFRADGMSVKDAATQAYTKTMGWKYQFADTYRVPNEVDGKEAARGAEATIDRLVRDGGARVYKDPNAPQILTDDALRARSMWITNSDESGLELRFRGLDGSVGAVHDKNGRPINISWADLLSNASQARVRDQTQEGHEEWLRRRNRDLNPHRDGMLEQGTIDLKQRPAAGGSAVRSIDGQSVLIPTVDAEGKALTEQEAIDAYRSTGQHFGKFFDYGAAAAYQHQLQQQKEQRYPPRK